MSEDRLKPCPFCGGDAIFVWAQPTLNNGRVKCRKPSCVAAGGRGYTKTEAIARWNTRAPLKIVRRRADPIVFDEDDNAQKGDEE